MLPRLGLLVLSIFISGFAPTLSELMASARYAGYRPMTFF
jgi:hypothetical protein